MRSAGAAIGVPEHFQTARGPPGPRGWLGAVTWAHHLLARRWWRKNSASIPWRHFYWEQKKAGSARRLHKSAGDIDAGPGGTGFPFGPMDSPDLIFSSDYNVSPNKAGEPGTGVGRPCPGEEGGAEGEVLPDA